MTDSEACLKPRLNPCFEDSCSEDSGYSGETFFTAEFVDDEFLNENDLIQEIDIEFEKHIQLDLTEIEHDIFYTEHEHAVEFDSDDEFSISYAQDGTRWILPRLSPDLKQVCAEIDACEKY